MPLQGFTWIVEGRLAGMPRPGVGASLTNALAALAELGVGLVISLTESPLPAAPIARQGMTALHLPVVDFTAPAPEQIARAVAAAKATWAERRAVVVHCAAGLGRTGTVLACLLVADGHAADAAVALVRRCRPGSIETAEQLAAVFAFARLAATPPGAGRAPHSSASEIDAQPEGS